MSINQCSNIKNIFNVLYYPDYNFHLIKSIILQLQNDNILFKNLTCISEINKISEELTLWKPEAIKYINSWGLSPAKDPLLGKKWISNGKSQQCKDSYQFFNYDTYQYENQLKTQTCRILTQPLDLSLNQTKLDFNSNIIGQEFCIPKSCINEIGLYDYNFDSKENNDPKLWLPKNSKDWEYYDPIRNFTCPFDSWIFCDSDKVSIDNYAIAGLIIFIVILLAVLDNTFRTFKRNRILRLGDLDTKTHYNKKLPFAIQDNYKSMKNTKFNKLEIKCLHSLKVLSCL